MHILILSRKPGSYSTGRLVEAALKKDHQADVVDYLQCSMVIEKGMPVIDYHGQNITGTQVYNVEKCEQFCGINAIIPRISASRTLYGAAVIRQFEMMQVFTTASSLGIVRTRDKLRSMQILAKKGIDLPRTVFASRPRDLQKIIEQVGGLPVVVKILEGTQGIGVVLVESHEAMRSVIEAFHSLKANILIQEYIRESHGSDIRAFIVGGKVVAAIRRQGGPGEFRSNIHRGGTATQVDLNGEEKATAIAAAKTLGLPIAGVDMLQSKRGPLVIEVNSSPGLEGIETATGMDIAGKIIDFIEKNVSRKKGYTDKVGV